MDWLLDFYNYRVVAHYLPSFARGLWATIWISAASLVIALIAGTVLALMRMSSRGILWRPAAGYIQSIRSTPLLVQIYLVYYGLPAVPLLGRRLDEIEGGILTLGLHSAAYMSEVIRAGIESVARGQEEGAKSVGMTYVQRMRYVILPQAFINMVSPILGQTIILVKDSSLLSIIAVFEVMSAGLWILSDRVMPNEGFLTTAACYLGIYACLFMISNWARRRLGSVSA